jgi:Methyltransferase domain
MFRDRLNALDVGLFGNIESQTWAADKRSLLALHGAVADRLGQFTYLEIGSYKGGSLQVLVRDERCRRIVSIDPRPEWVPGEGPWKEGVKYPENTTGGMLAALAAVPGGNVAKVETIELSTEQIDPAGFERPDLCFIDGEHTRVAILRDARFCREALRSRGVIAFHDFSAAPAAILEFLRESRPALGYWLRHDSFVIELGVPTLLSDPRIRQQLRLPAGVWGPLNAVGALPLLVEARRLRGRLRDLGRRR